MRQSQLFQITLKNDPVGEKAKSARLLTRADFIQKTASGIYAFLPLGWKVHQRLAELIRKSMFSLGAQELLLPSLQPKELWERSDRWESYVPKLFKLEDVHGKAYTIAPTHEELIAELASKRIKSYKELPFAIFQIQNKFRNETRAKGLLRTREFFMKDLYSFHVNENDLEDYYQRVSKAYIDIFQKAGLKAIQVEAATGSIGGHLSHEYAVLHESGEDKIYTCESCDYAVNAEVGEHSRQCPRCGKEALESKQGIELGHTFQLGTKYSEIFNVNYLDRKGERRLVHMGCYGIGVGRLMAAVVEVNHDQQGICWPLLIAPLAVHLVVLNRDEKLSKEAEKLYKQLLDNKIEVLFDDRQISAGEKLVDADLIGLPLRVVLSERTLSKKQIEVKKRKDKKAVNIYFDQLVPYLKKEINGR